MHPYHHRAVRFFLSYNMKLIFKISPIAFIPVGLSDTYYKIVFWRNIPFSNTIFTINSNRFIDTDNAPPQQYNYKALSLTSWNHISIIYMNAWFASNLLCDSLQIMTKFTVGEPCSYHDVAFSDQGTCGVINPFTFFLLSYIDALRVHVGWKAGDASGKTHVFVSVLRDDEMHIDECRDTMKKLARPFFAFLLFALYRHALTLLQSLFTQVIIALECRT